MALVTFVSNCRSLRLSTGLVRNRWTHSFLFRTLGNAIAPRYPTCSMKRFAAFKLLAPNSCNVRVGKTVFAFSATFYLYLQRDNKHAACEAVPLSRTRLSGLNNIGTVSEVKPFDWKKFWELTKPHILYLIGAFLSALVVAAINIQIPTLLGQIVNIVSKLTDARDVAAFIVRVQQPAMKLIYVYCVQGIFTFLYIAALSCAGERIAYQLRKELFSSLIQQDISFFDSHRTGELINRLTADVQDFKSSFKLCISQGLRSFTQTIGCVVSLYFISPKMTGVMVVILPGIILTGSLIGSMLRRVSRLAQEQVAKATAVADEAISNVRTVRAFAMEEKEIVLYGNEAQNAANLNEQLGIGIGAFQGLANLALNGIVLGVLYVGGFLISSNEMSAGDLMSFLVATQTIQRSLAQMSLLFGQFVRGMTAGARVFEYIGIEPTIPLSGGNIIPDNLLLGDVEFHNVTFSYPTRPDQVVLRQFNLHIPRGSVVALCGHSGGGKSTVASLLERFYDVDEGSVRLDGCDVRTLDPSWLRGHVIGFINQEPVLFATTVMENIRYGRPSATDQEVIEAARLANADEFINGFPQSYDTVLGERGVTVSGGQKQRIAIARALLKDPSILVLDEATSALDAESEKVVQEALDRVVKGRTVLIIAHRLSTIQNADIIAVLANGVIAEMGTHENLKKSQGLYWDLIRKQHQEERHRKQDKRPPGDL